MASTRKKHLKWLLPLWLAAALLLSAGLYARAQQPGDSTGPVQAQPAAGAQDRPANPASPQAQAPAVNPGDPSAPIASPEAAKQAQTPQSGIVADSAPAARNAGEMARQARADAHGTPIQ
ncbi:hypothetical protein [Longimicrobium sp.]|uniref:hypothetical protein n=1 Tax=Longimicrobium sp. TaxID=2029185 RepID=UPI002F93F42D